MYFRQYTSLGCREMQNENQEVGEVKLLLCEWKQQIQMFYQQVLDLLRKRICLLFKCISLMPKNRGQTCQNWSKKTQSQCSVNSLC